MIRRLPFAALSLAALCAAARVTAQAAPPAPATPPATQVASPRCERALADHRAVLATLTPEAAPWTEHIGSFGRCFATPHGAWLVALDALERVTHDNEGGYISVRGRWVVAHLNDDGTASRIVHDTEWMSHDLLRVVAASVFDYDGDGEPELTLATRAERLEWSDVPHGEVLTFRDGAIQNYAPAAGLSPEASQDVDHDGRPDLVTRAPYQSDGDDMASGFPYLMQGPTMVAHALADGSFARTDTAAVAYARAQCPQRVAAVFEAGVEPAATAVVCARLWGVAPAAVSRAVRRRCASVAEMSSGSPRRPHCGDLRVLQRWITATPPITLR